MPNPTAYTYGPPTSTVYEVRRRADRWEMWKHLPDRSRLLQHRRGAAGQRGLNVLAERLNRKIDARLSKRRVFPTPGPESRAASYRKQQEAKAERRAQLIATYSGLYLSESDRDYAETVCGGILRDLGVEPKNLSETS